MNTSHRAQARAIWRSFAARRGSEHIAKATAIEGVIKHIHRVKPEVVLEVGAGIGTLTYAIVQSLVETSGGDNAAFRFISIEDNPFCLGELSANLGSNMEFVQVIPSLAHLPSDVTSIDFLVVDGGASDPRYFSRLANRGAVLVEGYRAKQRDVMAQTLAGRRNITANFRSWNGREGYWLTQLDPTGAERARFWARSQYNRAVSRLRRFSAARPVRESTSESPRGGEA